MITETSGNPTFTHTYSWRQVAPRVMPKKLPETYTCTNNMFGFEYGQPFVDMRENANTIDRSIQLARFANAVDWDVTRVTNAVSMFAGNETLNPNLSNWNFSQIPTMPVGFDDNDVVTQRPVGW